MGDSARSGVILVNEFTFSVFKMKSVSKSIDMLSVDFQQEKAVARITKLSHDLTVRVASTHSLLARIGNHIKALEMKVVAVESNIKEAELVDKRRLRLEILHQGIPGRDPSGKSPRL